MQRAGVDSCCIVLSLSAQLKVVMSAERMAISYVWCNSLFTISRQHLCCSGWRNSHLVLCVLVSSAALLGPSISSFPVNNVARRTSDGKIMVSQYKPTSPTLHNFKKAIFWFPYTSSVQLLHSESVTWPLHTHIHAHTHTHCLCWLTQEWCSFAAHMLLFFTFLFHTNTLRNNASHENHAVCNQRSDCGWLLAIINSSCKV